MQRLQIGECYEEVIFVRLTNAQRLKTVRSGEGIEVMFADDLDGWVDYGEFPVPSLGEHLYWYQQAIGYDGWQDPDQLAVKMFYFFTWPS